MATTNPVQQVLVTSGDQAILAAGSRMDALNNGQLGIFNFHTGLSVDGSVPADCQDLVIAVGINRTTGGTDDAEDVRTSAGQVIQVRNSRFLTVKGYVAELPKIVDVTGFKAKCDTDYLLKINYFTRQGYQLNGYNNVAKTYPFHTGCCVETDDCDTCPTGDCIELAVGLVAAINADPDDLVTASLFTNNIAVTITGPATATGTLTFTIGTETFTAAVTDTDTATVVATAIAAAVNGTTTSNWVVSRTGAVLSIRPKLGVSTNTDTFAITGAVAGVGTSGIALSNVTITDTDAFKLAYPGACLGIKITGNAEVRPSFGFINVKYHKTGLNFEVSLTEGLGICNGAVTTAQALQYAEGKGYDLKQIEYLAGGQNGNPGPYRVTVATGFPKDIEYLTVEATNYNIVSLGYDQMSVGGWLEYLNNLETLIAIPCADTTTLVGLFTVLDLIFVNRFGAMTNDVAAMDCTNGRTGLLTPATDGIESLS